MLVNASLLLSLAACPGPPPNTPLPDVPDIPYDKPLRDPIREAWCDRIRAQLARSTQFAPSGGPCRPGMYCEARGLTCQMAGQISSGSCRCTPEELTMCQTTRCR